MKLRPLLLFIFLSCHFISVAQINYGKVKEEKQYCKPQKKQCKCDSLSTNICNSKNELEIRINYNDSNAVTHFLMLTYDSIKKWSAIVILDSFIFKDDRRTLIRESSQTYSLTPVISFDSIFNELKKNKIFRLPGISNFNGGGIILTYKAGNKIRHYNFPDPAQLRLFNPTRSGMNRYANIMNIFTNQLVFQQSDGK